MFAVQERTDRPLTFATASPVGTAGGVRSVGVAGTDADTGEVLPWVSTATRAYA